MADDVLVHGGSTWPTCPAGVGVHDRIPAGHRRAPETTAPRLHPHERARYRAAAGHARRIYPGPLGELVHRELSAYAEFGHRFTDDGLISRLAAAVLATPTPEPLR